MRFLGLDFQRARHRQLSFSAKQCKSFRMPWRCARTFHLAGTPVPCGVWPGGWGLAPPPSCFLAFPSRGHVSYSTNNYSISHQKTPCNNYFSRIAQRFIFLQHNNAPDENRSQQSSNPVAIHGAKSGKRVQFPETPCKLSCCFIWCFVVRPAGIEPAALGFGGQYSIH